MDLSCLSQTWLHSHEEDSGDRQVYRPESFDFPPSRGRTGFCFGREGSATISGPSPTDASESHAGRWSFVEPNRLTIQEPDRPARRLEVVELAPDKLVVKDLSG